MKKKVLSFLLMMLPALLLTSCLKDQDDLFSDSASQRAANYLDKARKVLVSSENGWVLDYFPHSEQAYGGYSYTLKFDDQYVTVCSEVADDVTKSIKSTYILDNEDGPCISFDTYNEYMHYFATPTGASGPGGYEAYGGDYIFIILDISEDENTITLKGNRSGNIMYMHRLTESISDYQQKLADFVENLVFDKAAADIDGKKYNLTIDASNKKMTIAPETPAEGEETIEAPFCFDKDGFSFYKPVTINGKEVRVFTYNESEGTFVAQEDNSVVFKALLLPSIITNKTGENIYLGVAASTLKYSINLADQFTYTSDVDWITVSVDGKNLTFNIAANTTGDSRTGTVTVETNGQKATIKISQVPLNQIFANSDAFIVYSKVSPALQPTFWACKETSDKDGETISLMVFTTWDEAEFATGYGIYFQSSGYRGLIALDPQMISSDKIKFVYNSGRNDKYGNAAYYYNHGYSTLVNYLTSTTFTIATDDEANPTYFKLTDDNDSSKYFTLSVKQVNNPFSN